VNKPSLVAHEKAHGKQLAQGEPEMTWGWGTPAGKLRSKRRAGLISEGALMKEGTRVLEIVCGNALFTEMFAKTGATIVALDLSSHLLGLASTRNLPQNQVQFVEKRIEEFETEQPFDAVIGSSVLHHLELDVALNRIFDLIKPNGLISFAEPNLWNPQVFIERRFRRFFPSVSPDETAFARRSFGALLRGKGFKEIRITPFDWLHPATPSRWISMVERCGRILEKTPLLREFSGSLLIRAKRPPL